MGPRKRRVKARGEPFEPEVLDRVRRCARIIDEKKGIEIAVLDTRFLTFVDCFLLATAESGKQLKAIADETERYLAASGADFRGSDGTPASGWVVVDAGDFMVHLFLPHARRLYDLEMLWGDAPKVDVTGDGRNTEVRRQETKE